MPGGGIQLVRKKQILILISVADGYLTFNGTRCRKYLPGLFFTYDGEALDFRGTVPTFRNIALSRTRR